MKPGYLARIYLILFFNAVLVQIAAAQLTEDSMKVEIPKTKLEISVEGLSNAIYAGRNFGVDQSGLNPSITFNHKSGFNLSVYSYGMSKTPGLIQETDLGISYSWHLSSHINITPGYSYIFNRTDSANILNNNINVNTGLELSFISISNYFAFSFGKSTALYDELSASKYFSLLSKAGINVSLSPTFVWVLGTKQALATIAHGKTSYKTKVGKGISNGNGHVHSTTTTTSVDTTNQFMSFSYDFMLPVTLTVKNLAFSVIPHYDIPVNITPAESTLTGNPLYISVKIAYTIPFQGKLK